MIDPVLKTKMMLEGTVIPDPRCERFVNAAVEYLHPFRKTVGVRLIDDDAFVRHGLNIGLAPNNTFLKVLEDLGGVPDWFSTKKFEAHFVVAILHTLGCVPEMAPWRAVLFLPLDRAHTITSSSVLEYYISAIEVSAIQQAADKSKRMEITRQEAINTIQSIVVPKVNNMIRDSLEFYDRTISKCILEIS